MIVSESPLGDTVETYQFRAEWDLHQDEASIMTFVSLLPRAVVDRMSDGAFPLGMGWEWLSRNLVTEAHVWLQISVVEERDRDEYGEWRSLQFSIDDVRLCGVLLKLGDWSEVVPIISDDGSALDGFAIEFLRDWVDGEIRREEHETARQLLEIYA